MAASLPFFPKLRKLPKIICQHAPMVISGFRDVIKTYANNKDNYPVSPVIWLVMVGKMLPVDH